MTAARCLIGYPIYNDPSATITPVYSAGNWSGTLPLTNLSDRRLAKVARSTDATLASTRFAIDLGAARAVGLIGIPKHTLSQAAKVRIVGQTPGALTSLFDYEAGDDIVAKGGTFTRASVATYVDSAGIVRQAASGEARDGHFIGGLRSVLLEESRQNSGLWSRDLTGASWTTSGTGSRTQNAPGLVDGTANSATTLTDTDAAAQMLAQQNVTVVNNNATHTGTVYFKRTTGATSFPRFDLLLVGGTTVYRRYILNTNTGVLGGLGDAGTGTSRCYAYGSGWWAVEHTVTNNTTGNLTLQANLYGAASVDGTTASTAAQGSCIVGQVQIELNATFGSSPIFTTTAAVTRAVDLLQFPPIAPQSMSVYAKIVDAGYRLQLNGTVWGMGNASANNPYLAEQAGSVFYHDGVAQSSGTLALTHAIGDTIESLATLNATADATITRIVNGGAPASGTTGTTATLFPAAFSAPAFITVGGGTAWASAFVAFQSFRIVAGVQTFATMQGAVYDSGWLDVWPQVFPAGSLPSNDPRSVTGKYSAEDAAGFNIGFVHIPATPQVAQLWSVQIDDSANAAGYVDLGRLVIANTYQPTINMSQGAKLSLASATTRTQTDGGAAVYNDKPRWREQVFTIDYLDEDEALVNFFDMQRRIGTSGQLYFAHNAADTYHMHRRAFLCTMRELSAIEYPFGTRTNVPFAVIEEL